MADTCKIRAPSTNIGATVRFKNPEIVTVTIHSNTAFSKWLLRPHLFMEQKNRLAKRLAKRL